MDGERLRIDFLLCNRPQGGTAEGALEVSKGATPPKHASNLAEPQLVCLAETRDLPSLSPSSSPPGSECTPSSKCASPPRSESSKSPDTAAQQSDAQFLRILAQASEQPASHTMEYTRARSYGPAALLPPPSSSLLPSQQQSSSIPTPSAPRFLLDRIKREEQEEPSRASARGSGGPVFHNPSTVDHRTQPYPLKPAARASIVLPPLPFAPGAASSAAASFAPQPHSSSYQPSSSSMQYAVPPPAAPAKQHHPAVPAVSMQAPQPWAGARTPALPRQPGPEEAALASVDKQALLARVRKAAYYRVSLMEESTPAQQPAPVLGAAFPLSAAAAANASASATERIACFFSKTCDKKVKGKGNLRRHVEWHLRCLETQLRCRDISVSELQHLAALVESANNPNPGNTSSSSITHGSNDSAYARQQMQAGWVPSSSPHSLHPMQQQVSQPSPSQHPASYARPPAAPAPSPYAAPRTLLPPPQSSPTSAVSSFHGFATSIQSAPMMGALSAMPPSLMPPRHL